MAEGQGEGHADENLEPEVTAGYKIPEKKSMNDIINQDAEDESLRKYKENLLGGAGGLSGDNIFFADDPRRVIIRKLSLLPVDRDPVVLNVDGLTAEELKKQAFIIKEGTSYRMQFEFHVQRDIVTGLQLVTSVHKKALGGIRVDKIDVMMGSYGPRAEAYIFTSPEEDAASGMMARGNYTVKARFVDDDKHEHMKLEWTIDIKKDWK